MTAFRTEVQDGIARVQFDLPGEPVNKITRDVRNELETLLDLLQAEKAVRAVVLISGKSDTFIAGADIDEFVALKNRDQARKLVQAGQVLINQFEELGKPTVAAIHGACLGGGLEAALACTYRIATDDPKTSLGLPEVQLGIIPAAGGCQRLPRLIGVRAALDIILVGKTLPAKRAFKIGMVDELVHPAILQDVAVAAAKRLAEGWQPKRDGRGVAGLLLDRNPLGRRIVFSQAKKQVIKKTGGNYPAPIAALQAVEHGLTYGIDAGLDHESARFGELAVGDVSKHLVRIFFATTALKKDAGVTGVAPEPRDVKNVAVVGAGFMGSAIAGVAVERAGADVRLRDTKLEAVASGLSAARKILQHRLKRRRITKYDFRRMSSLLSGGIDWAGFGRADLVIEAVFEDVAVKHEVFREIESQVAPSCILASNTSTIPITRIAEVARDPTRVIGMHFFSPVEKMPLLEVIVTEQTAAAVTVTAVQFGRRMGKTAIVVRDSPGFWVNRILAPYLNEAGHLLRDGVPVETIDGAMRSFGFPVGPITLLDEIGLDVSVKASAVLHDAFGDRMAPVPGLGRMTVQGRLGRKSGRGFYRYEKGKKGKVDSSAYELLGVKTGRSVPEEDVTRRLVFALLNEAAMALAEGVVRSPRDGDIGAIFGFGFPPFRGGPLRYMDDLGVDQVRARLDELAERYGDRFAPAPVIQQMAAGSDRFYPSS